MKTYEFDGREYVESGEFRCPRKGEVFVSKPHGNPLRDMIGTYDERKILIPKEQKMNEEKWRGAKYVLILKAFAPGVAGCVNRILEVESVHEKGERYAFDTVQLRGRGTCTTDTHWAWTADCALPLPDCTEEIFNAHWGIEAAKADTIPAPVLEALGAENIQVCGGARKYARDLVEAIYRNPPKA